MSCVYADFNKSLVLSGSWDSTTKLWDIRTGKCVQTFPVHTKGVNTVQFDDRYVVSGSVRPSPYWFTCVGWPYGQNNRLLFWNCPSHHWCNGELWPIDPSWHEEISIGNRNKTKAQRSISEMLAVWWSEAGYWVQKISIVILLGMCMEMHHYGAWKPLNIWAILWIHQPQMDILPMDYSLMIKGWL